MGKFNNRPGFGALRGSKNPLHTTSYVAPKNPKKNHMWTNLYNGVDSFWDGSAWIPKSIINQKVGTPLFTWVGTQTEYNALTPDDTWIYFIIP